MVVASITPTPFYKWVGAYYTNMTRGNSTVEQALIEMDEMIAGVMPESWHGHARIMIAGKDLSEKQHTLATKLSKRLLEKGKVADAEKAARLSVEKAQEKYE